MARVCREISPKLEACGGSIMGRRSCVTAHTIGHRGKDPVKISSVIGRSFLPGKVLSVQLAPCSPEYTVNQLPVCKSGSMSTHKYSAFRPSPPPSLPFIHHRTRQDLYHCRSTNKLIDTVIPFNETSLRTSSLANSVVIISDSKSFTTNPAYGASASSNSISTPSSNTIPGPAAFDSAAKPPEFTNDELKHLSAFVASLAVDPKVSLPLLLLKQDISLTFIPG